MSSPFYVNEGSAPQHGNTSPRLVYPSSHHTLHHMATPRDHRGDMLQHGSSTASTPTSPTTLATFYHTHSPAYQIDHLSSPHDLRYSNTTHSAGDDQLAHLSSTAHVLSHSAYSSNITSLEPPTSGSLSPSQSKSQSSHPTHRRADSQSDQHEAPPIWADMKTKAGKDRKRLPLACIACRRKKIRCSGEKPACKHCLRARTPCVYKVTQRKAAPPTNYMAMLDKRLKRMEDRVIKIIPKDEAGESVSPGPRAVLKPGAGPNTSPARAAQHQRTGKRRTADEAFESQIEEWSDTPAHASAIPTKASGNLNTSDALNEKTLLTEGAEHLPPTDIQEHLAEVYFDYVYGQTYPLLHKPSYMRKLAAGTIPPVLVLAVCAVSARFSTHPKVPDGPAPFLRGECWAKPAREIALKQYDTPNITTLTVYLLLGLHEFGTCQGGRSWMFGGMAQRMAYALQLHRDLDRDAFNQMQNSSAEMSCTDREIRRRTMWSCFLMDRFNSSGTQRPMFVNEQYLRLQLPICEDYFNMEIPGLTESLEGAPSTTALLADQSIASDPHSNLGIAAYIVRGVALWGRLIQYMNLGGREDDEHPMWSAQSTYHQLHQQVLAFENSLPAHLQYSDDNLHSHATENNANQFLYLHIVCKQIKLFINRFAFPNMSGTRVPKDMPASFLKNARTVALESAASISQLVEAGMKHRLVVPFAGYCTYLSSAVHIHGIFSRQPRLEAESKRHLVTNIKYLTQMKKYWGMFHFMSESLKDLYRQHADNAKKGEDSQSKDHIKSIFQYGDWYDRYPSGVSNLDYEDPAVKAAATAAAAANATLAEKSDLQSVEDFFATAHAQVAPSRRPQKKARSTKAASPVRATSHSVPILERSMSEHSPSTVVSSAYQRPLHLQQGVQPAYSDMTLSHSPVSFGFDHQPADASHVDGMDTQSGTLLSSFDPMLPVNSLANNMAQLEQQFILNSYNGMDQSFGAPPAVMPDNVWTMDFGGVSGAGASNANTSTTHSLNTSSQGQANLMPHSDHHATTFNPAGGDGFLGGESAGSAWFMPFNFPVPGDDDGVASGARRHLPRTSASVASPTSAVSGSFPPSVAQLPDYVAMQRIQSGHSSIDMAMTEH